MKIQQRFNIPSLLKFSTRALCIFLFIVPIYHGDFVVAQSKYQDSYDYSYDDYPNYYDGNGRDDYYYHEQRIRPFSKVTCIFFKTTF